MHIPFTMEVVFTQTISIKGKDLKERILTNESEKNSAGLQKKVTVVCRFFLKKENEWKLNELNVNLCMKKRQVVPLKQAGEVSSLLHGWEKK